MADPGRTASRKDAGSSPAPAPGGKEMKRHRELTTDVWQTARFGQRKRRVIRVRKQSKFGRVRYCMNNWLFVPAWMRILDGWTVRVALTLAALALAFVGAGAIMLLRLVVRAR